MTKQARVAFAGRHQGAGRYGFTILNVAQTVSAKHEPASVLKPLANRAVKWRAGFSLNVFAWPMVCERGDAAPFLLLYATVLAISGLRVRFKFPLRSWPVYISTDQPRTFQLSSTCSVPRPGYRRTVSTHQQIKPLDGLHGLGQSPAPLRGSENIAFSAPYPGHSANESAPAISTVSTSALLEAKDGAANLRAQLGHQEVECPRGGPLAISWSSSATVESPCGSHMLEDRRRATGKSFFQLALVQSRGKFA